MIKALIKKIRMFLDRWPKCNGGLQTFDGKWHVLYPDGRWSMRMRYDEACNYAEIFDGKVIHITDRKD